MDKKYLDIFRKMAKRAGEVDDAHLSAAINCFMDGVDADLNGTHQGWSASSDYALEMIGMKEPKDQSPDGYLNLIDEILDTLDLGTAQKITGDVVTLQAELNLTDQQMIKYLEDVVRQYQNAGERGTE